MSGNISKQANVPLPDTSNRKPQHHMSQHHLQAQQQQQYHNQHSASQQHLQINSASANHLLNINSNSHGHHHHHHHHSTGQLSAVASKTASLLGPTSVVVGDQAGSKSASNLGVVRGASGQQQIDRSDSASLPSSTSTSESMFKRRSG